MNRVNRSIFTASIVLAMAFTQSFAQENDFFTDARDRKTYNIVKIGEQTWMAENLNYNAKGSECYDNKEANCKKYGRLYDWEATKNVCPEGWHLPNDLEWDSLYKHVGRKVAEKTLKAKSGWNYSNDDCEGRDKDECDEYRSEYCIGESGNGEDKYGFSALPGGFKGPYANGFGHVGELGYWWSASESYMSMGSRCDPDGDWGKYKSNSYSIRCVQGEASVEEAAAETKAAASQSRGVLKMLTAKSSKTNFSSYNLAKDKSFAKDIDNVLKNVANLQTDGNTDTLRGERSSGYAEGGSGDGSRSKAEIMAVVNARMPGLRRTYNQYLKTNPGLTGKVMLKFTIAPSGTITSISIVSSTTGNSKFDNAIKDAVATWRWKTIKSGDTTPTIPFNFAE